MNNNREWFQPHKQEYTRFLYEPMKQLGQDLYQPFADKPGTVLKVSRIYRDARLHHPTPYKESLWACIRQDGQWWAEYPCLFFEVRPEGVLYGLIWWHPRVSTLDAFRQAISGKPEEFLGLIHSTEQATGIPISADLYKRPKPVSDERLQPYGCWKGNVTCIQEEPVSEDLFTPDLGIRAKQFLEKLIPLYDYLNRFNV